MVPVKSPGDFEANGAGSAQGEGWVEAVLGTGLLVLPGPTGTQNEARPIKLFALTFLAQNYQAFLGATQNYMTRQTEGVQSGRKPVCPNTPG